MKRFKFVKELKLKDGTFPVGAEITVDDVGRMYYNGGMVEPSFYGLLSDLIEYEQSKGFKHLREVPIPFNKI